MRNWSVQCAEGDRQRRLLTESDTQLHPDARLRSGVQLDDGPTRPAGVRRIGGSRIEITLHEGRNRQVKRMLEEVGHRVKRLHRSRYGPLTLEGLEPGRWRELEPFEVERLRALRQGSPPQAHAPGRAGPEPA